MHQTIPLDPCCRIVDWLHHRGIEFYLESNNGLFASEHFREAGLPVLLASMGEEGELQDQEMDVEDILHGMVFGANLYRDDVNKVSYILSSYQDYLDACEAFPDFACGTWGLSRMLRRCLPCSSRRAIRRSCSRLRIASA